MLSEALGATRTRCPRAGRADRRPGTAGPGPAGRGGRAGAGRRRTRRPAGRDRRPARRADRRAGPPGRERPRAGGPGRGRRALVAVAGHPRRPGRAARRGAGRHRPDPRRRAGAGAGAAAGRRARRSWPATTGRASTRWCPRCCCAVVGRADPGAVRLFGYDPEHLGGGLAGFAPLGTAGLLTFVGPGGLGRLLDDLVEQIRRINETVLAGEYALAARAGRGDRPAPGAVAGGGAARRRTSCPGTSAASWTGWSAPARPAGCTWWCAACAARRPDRAPGSWSRRRGAAIGGSAGLPVTPRRAATGHPGHRDLPGDRRPGQRRPAADPLRRPAPAAGADVEGGLGARADRADRRGRRTAGRCC